MNQDLLSRTPSNNSLNTWCWMELASSLEMTGPPYYSIIWIWNFARFDQSMRQWGAKSCTARHPNISCTLPLPRSALVLCNPSGRRLVLARPLEMSIWLFQARDGQVWPVKHHTLNYPQRRPRVSRPWRDWREALHFESRHGWKGDMETPEGFI